MKQLIACGTCGYPLTPEERAGLLEVGGVMVKPAQQQEPEPVAYLHQCGKKPELKELSFKKNEPSLSAKGYKPIPLTSPQPAQQEHLPPEWYRQWILNNYSDYWTIKMLCDEMTKAAHNIKEKNT